VQAESREGIDNREAIRGLDLVGGPMRDLGTCAARDGARSPAVAADADWRRKLRRNIAWALLVKLAVLVALWSLFFSGEHRVEVTARALDTQLSLQLPLDGTSPVSRKTQP